MFSTVKMNPNGFSAITVGEKTSKKYPKIILLHVQSVHVHMCCGSIFLCMYMYSVHVHVYDDLTQQYTAVHACLQCTFMVQYTVHVVIFHVL